MRIVMQDVVAGLADRDIDLVVRSKANPAEAPARQAVLPQRADWPAVARQHRN